MAFYEVIVGNVGKVFEGSNGFEARQNYNHYVGQSKRKVGRASGEQVSLWKDNEILEEYIPIETLDGNYRSW